MRVSLPKVIFALVTTAIALCAADRQTGTWKLNLEKSRYTADHPAPKSLTVNIQEQEGALKFNVEGQDAQGNAIHIQFSVKGDGKDYPETGSPNSDTVAMRRIDANTIEIVN